MLSAYLFNVNKKKEFASNILSIMQVEDLDKLKYDISYTLNNKIFSNDELLDKILDNNLYEVFKVVIEKNILLFTNLKMNKLFDYDFSKKVKYFEVIIQNMDTNKLLNLLTLIIYKENTDEVIFEMILKKFKIINENNDNIEIYKKIINDCCYNNKLSYVQIILDHVFIKLNYDNSEVLFKIITSHLLCDMTDIFKFAILKGACVKDREESFLIEAINFNRANIIDLLLDKYKVKINICDNLPIRKAFETNNFDLVLKILDKGSFNAPIDIGKIFNLGVFIYNIINYPNKYINIKTKNMNINSFYIKCSCCKNYYEKELLIQWLYKSRDDNTLIKCPNCHNYWNNYRIYKVID